MLNDTSTKSTTEQKLSALDVRAVRLQDRRPKLTLAEAAMICETADNIVRYARRQTAEMAAAVVVQEARPVVLHEIPALPPARPRSGQVKERIVAYMTHDHQDLVTMHGVAKALGEKYDRVRYGFRLLADKVVRGPDIRRPRGGTPIHQYRLLPEVAVAA